MTDPRFPLRPEHNDLWLMSQALIDTDAQADTGQPIDDIVGRYVDLESLAYMAEQRALRALGPGAPEKLSTLLAATWMDAFLAGVQFQNLKSTGAQTAPETP